MSWAKYAIEALQNGETTQIRPRGHSMTGKVNHRDLVTLKPADVDDLEIGDTVLVGVKGRVYLPLIKARKQNRFLIGNNRGGINGWVGENAICGKATQVKG